MQTDRGKQHFLWLGALFVLTTLLMATSPGEIQAAPQDHGASDAHADVDQTDAGHAEAAEHGEAIEHGEEHGDSHSEHIELPHLIMVLFTWFVDPDSTFGHYLHVFENPFFAILVGVFLSVVAISVYRRRSDVPGRLQAFVEMIVEQADNMVCTVMGPVGRHYTPFIGTIFVYLICMNYFGLVPLGKAPTATYINNISIALLVFLYVQYTGIRKNGLWGYFKHLCGSPKDATGWALAPLMLFLEIFGELIKPISLSLRLFGNIFGEDMLLAIFALLGVVLTKLFWGTFGVDAPAWLGGVPLHIPFMLLSLLLGAIQALVFSLLTTVYISLMLPHGDHDHDEAHGKDEDHAVAAIGASDGAVVSVE